MKDTSAGKIALRHALYRKSFISNFFSFLAFLLFSRAFFVVWTNITYIVHCKGKAVQSVDLWIFDTRHSFHANLRSELHELIQGKCRRIVKRIIYVTSVKKRFTFRNTSASSRESAGLPALSITEADSIPANLKENLSVYWQILNRHSELWHHQRAKPPDRYWFASYSSHDIANHDLPLLSRIQGVFRSFWAYLWKFDLVLRLREVFALLSQPPTPL